MEEKAPKVTRRWWKWPAIIAGSLVALVLAVLVAIPLVLTPERLTRWVRDYGTEYLVDGRVDVARVDLSVWSTFPHAVLTIDSLRVDNLAVPADYRQVLGCERIEGRLNLAALLIGRISVGHAQLSRPQATLWFGADSLQSSLSILPPSEPDEPDKEPLSLPDLRINRFIIAGDACVRYVSEPDSIDAAVVIHQTSLYGYDSYPEYVLAVDGLAQLPLELMAVDSLTLFADGSICWNPAEPLSVELEDFTVAVDSIETCTSLKADFADGLRLEKLKFQLLPVGVQHLASLVKQAPELITPATVSARAELLSPYVYNPDTLLIPDLRAELLLDNAPLEIPQWYLNLTNVALDLQADLSSAGLDASTVKLRRLNVQFPASDFTLSGDATNLLSDPEINGCFRGKVDFTNLNPRLWTLIGMRLRGALDADVDIESRVSNLNLEGIHNARLRGEASLRNFLAVMPADTLAFAAHRAQLTFGTANGLHGIDSLLTASLSVDTLKAYMPGMSARMAGVSLGVGVKNLNTLDDTTVITPMGGRLKIKSLRYEGADSTRARAGDLDGVLTLTRYKNGAKSPRLSSRLTAKRLSLASGPTLTSLRGIEVAALAHSEPRTPRKRQLSHADSLRRAARRDSILMGQSNVETLDFGIDRSSVILLKRWNLRGHVLAKTGGVVTPLFPLRTRLRNLNLDFSADSVNLRSLKIIAGRSDLSVSGSIANIQRSLGRRRSSAPLTMRLDLSADTLNVNQLTQAAFRGAAYAAKTDSLSMATAAIDSDAEAIESSPEAEEEMMAIVVPMNIDAMVNLSAKNIIYSNLALKDFGGQILVAKGAANLRDLHAATDIGSVDLNMLYYAPSLNDVNFGLGLDLRRFNIGRVTELIPSLDSIMPILNSLGGIVDVGITATTPVDSMLNIKVPELRAMLELSGDSLRVLDEQTFKTISKWLFFHDKKKNLIDHMDVKLTVEDNRLSLYPFMFDFDRYRIGVMGHNDMDLNLDYHVSVLRSPIPFKFGVNVKGNADKMKIRLGRARFKEQMAAESTALADTVRLNLAREMRNVFTRGANAARLGPLDIRRPEELPQVDEAADTLSASELLQLPDSIPN